MASKKIHAYWRVLNNIDDRRKALEILDTAVCAGARARAVAAQLEVG